MNFFSVREETVCWLVHIQLDRNQAEIQHSRFDNIYLKFHLHNSPCQDLSPVISTRPWQITTCRSVTVSIEFGANILAMYVFFIKYLIFFSTSLLKIILEKWLWLGLGC